MKPKLLSRTDTTQWEYDDKVIIFTKIKRLPDTIYFSNAKSLMKWDKKDGFIDLTPKPKFITRFKLWVKRFLLVFGGIA